MYKWTVLYIFFFGFSLQALATIIVKGLIGTDSAVLGTNNTVITCDYDYENENGVEVKWFFNNNTQIFIWIPEYNQPQPMGKFWSTFLDVNNNSIRFKETIRNLTGYYTCKVTSYDTEDSATELMTVYQPPIKTGFFPEESSQTLICFAYESYPQPVITITGSQSSESNESISVRVESELANSENGIYNVTQISKFDREAIKASAEFVCNIYIPDTGFNRTIRLTYEKIGNETETETTTTDEFTTIPTETTATISTIRTRNTSKTQGKDFGVPTAEVSKWLMLVMLIILIISSKQ